MEIIVIVAMDYCNYYNGEVCSRRLQVMTIFWKPKVYLNKGILPNVALHYCLAAPLLFAALQQGCQVLMDKKCQIASKNAKQTETGW